MNGGLHLAVVGTGRVGRATTASLLGEPWLEEVTLIDTEPNLAGALELDLKHSLGAIEKDLTVNSSPEPKEAAGADLVLITASEPRTPEMDSRDQLARPNAEVMASLARKLGQKNPDAFYVVVTNPVDAMATLFAELSPADRVISTGTNLESSRFRSELARHLGVSITDLEAYVAGEHGEESVFLWSMVTVKGEPLNRYLDRTDMEFEKERIEERVRSQPLEIIDGAGATRLGPAASFRQILRAIARDRGELLPVAAPCPSITNSEVLLSLPRPVGQEIGEPDSEHLSGREEHLLREAADKIQETHQFSRRQLR